MQLFTALACTDGSPSGCSSASNHGRGLTRFDARDPYQAGCELQIEGLELE
jgi:hypothetical protein